MSTDRERLAILAADEAVAYFVETIERRLRDSVVDHETYLQSWRDDLDAIAADVELNAEGLLQDDQIREKVARLKAKREALEILGRLYGRPTHTYEIIDEADDGEHAGESPGTDEADALGTFNRDALNYKGSLQEDPLGPAIVYGDAIFRARLSKPPEAAADLHRSAGDDERQTLRDELRRRFTTAVAASRKPSEHAERFKLRSEVYAEVLGLLGDDDEVLAGLAAEQEVTVANRNLSQEWSR